MVLAISSANAIAKMVVFFVFRPTPKAVLANSFEMRCKQNMFLFSLSFSDDIRPSQAL